MAFDDICTGLTWDWMGTELFCVSPGSLSGDGKWGGTRAFSEASNGAGKGEMDSSRDDEGASDVEASEQLG